MAEVRKDCVSLKFDIIGKAFVKHTHTHTCFLGTGKESPLLERLCCDCVLWSFLSPLKEIYGAIGHYFQMTQSIVTHKSKHIYKTMNI